MKMDNENEVNRQKNMSDAAKRALFEAEERRKNKAEMIMPTEINGSKYPEPTRFSDWEKKGIICDF
jgi:hypothetical protein